MSTFIIWFDVEALESTVGTLTGNYSAFNSVDNRLPFAILSDQGFNLQTQESNDPNSIELVQV